MRGKAVSARRERNTPKQSEGGWSPSAETALGGWGDSALPRQAVSRNEYGKMRRRGADKPEQKLLLFHFRRCRQKKKTILFRVFARVRTRAPHSAEGLGKYFFHRTSSCAGQSRINTGRKFLEEN